MGIDTNFMLSFMATDFRSREAFAHITAFLIKQAALQLNGVVQEKIFLSMFIINT